MRRLLLWFKQDVRLDDHPAVQAAVKAERLLPVFVLDPSLLHTGPFGTRRMGIHRTRFLLESLAALDRELKQRGSQLLVVLGNAELLIPQLAQQLEVTSVLTLEEIAPEERQQVARVREALGPIRLLEYAGNDLLFPEQLPCPPEHLPHVFSQFRQEIENRPPVFQYRPAPVTLPGVPEQSADLFRRLPTLSQLGLGEAQSSANSAFPFSGGETAALARLRDYLWNSQHVRDYQETRDQMLGTEYSSKLSPWLANGSLCVRRVAADLRRHEALYQANNSTRCLWGELLWREFFRRTLQRHGCALFQSGGLKATERASRLIDERFVRWTQGRTGMPLVDACMRELAETGYLSNRGRQVAASYLVQDLQQDWRYGASWFEEHLLDYDVASNWGNWAYLAGVSCDPRHSMAFNALRQAHQYDPEASYVSLWLPELRHVPQHLRHTPFILSAQQLEALDYPRIGMVPAAWKPYLPEAA